MPTRRAWISACEGDVKPSTHTHTPRKMEHKPAPAACASDCRSATPSRSLRIFPAQAHGGPPRRPSHRLQRETPARLRMQRAPATPQSRRALTLKVDAELRVRAPTALRGRKHEPRRARRARRHRRGWLFGPGARALRRREKPSRSRLRRVGGRVVSLTFALTLALARPGPLGGRRQDVKAHCTGGSRVAGFTPAAPFCAHVRKA